MADSMKDNQQGVATVTFLDTKGNPTTPPPAALPLAWSVDQPAVFGLAPSGDSLTCTVTALGPLSPNGATVTVTAADGSFTGSDTITVGASAPKTVAVTLGTVTDQP